VAGHETARRTRIAPRRLAILIGAGLLAVVVLVASLLLPRSDGVVAASGWVAASSPAVAREGAWLIGPDGRSTGAGTVSIEFHGRAIAWMADVRAMNGVTDVFVDGRKRGAVSADDVDAVGTAFTVQDLSEGVHTLDLRSAGSAAWTSVEAFQVYADAPPVPPSTLRLDRVLGGVELRWQTSDADEKMAIFRSGPDGGFDRIAELPAGSTSYVDPVSPAAEPEPVYALTRVSTDATMSAASATDVVPMTDRVPLSYPRLSDCPAGGETVATSSALRRALSELSPGDVLRVEPGVYRGSFVVTARGTAADPIWICGAGAVLRGATVEYGYGLHVADASHVMIAGMRVEHSRKGIMVDRSDHIVIVDSAVHETGNEGIHLRARTTDSIVAHNTVRDTGLQASPPRPQWGEGIYVGSHYSNWCAVDYQGCEPGCRGASCEPDRSDRNAIVFNDIARTSAEAIDVKEGATFGIIADNEIRMSASSIATRWIVVRSRDWIIADNEGASVRGMNGIEVYRPPVPGYGTGNLIADNHAVLPADGEGDFFAVDIRESGNIVQCDNTLRGARDYGLTNTECEDPR